MNDIIAELLEVPPVDPNISNGGRNGDVVDQILLQMKSVDLSAPSGFTRLRRWLRALEWKQVTIGQLLDLKGKIFRTLAVFRISKLQRPKFGDLDELHPMDAFLAGRLITAENAVSLLKDWNQYQCHICLGKSLYEWINQLTISQLETKMKTMTPRWILDVAQDKRNKQKSSR